MKRGPSRRRTRVQRRPSNRSRNSRKPAAGCTALCVLDQTPFLKKALGACRRLSTELHKKQEQLRLFEESDQAAFKTWINANFGAQLTRTRELAKEKAAYEFILQNLDMCLTFLPEKFDEVYRELMERKEKDTLHGFVPPKGFDDDDDLEDAAEEAFSGGNQENEKNGPDNSKGPFDEDFLRDLEDFFKSMGFDLGEESEELDERQQKKPTPGVIKSVYRMIAKRLHPDVSKIEPSLRDRRWHELCEAYENDDLQAMQRIEAMCDMEEEGLSTELGLARLREIAAYHQSHLKPLRRALKEAKRDPAFGFATEGPTPKLKSTIGREFKLGLHNLSLELEQMQTAIENMALEARDDWSDEDEFEEIDDWVLHIPPKPPAFKQKHSRPAKAESEAQMKFF